MFTGGLECNNDSVQKEKFFYLMNLIPCGITLSNKPLGKYEVHNLKARKFFRLETGTERKDLKNYTVLKNGKELSVEELPLTIAVKYGVEVNKEKLEFHWNDGIVKNAYVSAVPIYDQKDNICCGVSIIEEISNGYPLNIYEEALNSYEDVKSGRRIEKILPSQILFYAAFHASPIIKMIIRASDYTFIDINQQFLRTFGYTRDDVIGKTIFGFIGKEKALKEALSQLRDNGKLDEIEFQLNEGTFLVSGLAVPFKQESFYLLNMINITNLKEAESQIHRLNIVGKLAASIGHEVRNPMATVRGYLQLLSMRPENTQEKSKYDIMISELDRVNAMLTEFLSLAKKKKANLRVHNLNDVIKRSIPLLEADAHANHKYIEFNLQQDLPDIILDPDEINQLLLNLSRNGLEAMGKSGTLTISTYVKDQHVILSVKDEGKGIPKELRKKIGTPFFTTKEKGTGMGLYICHNIVERHGGKIEIGECDKGTNFLISFPIPK